ncbi:hypothetical protein FBU30_007303 [Linnemannia zychae]|nr:hypothetical protein FBU30_007303 [Linnemannia zychae]
MPVTTASAVTDATVDVTPDHHANHAASLFDQFKHDDSDSVDLGHVFAANEASIRHTVIGFLLAIALAAVVLNKSYGIFAKPLLYSWTAQPLNYNRRGGLFTLIPFIQFSCSFAPYSDSDGFSVLVVSVIFEG